MAIHRAVKTKHHTTSKSETIILGEGEGKETDLRTEE